MNRVARRWPFAEAMIASACGAAVRSWSCIVAKKPSVSLNDSSPLAQPPAGANATTESARPRAASCSAT
jgi:hypothetical protein